MSTSAYCQKDPVPPRAFVLIVNEDGRDFQNYFSVSPSEQTERKKKMLNCWKGTGIYRDTLNKEARERYMEKIMIINGLDPYEIPTKEWSSDEDLLPQFCTTHVFGYLV